MADRTVKTFVWDTATSSVAATLSTLLFAALPADRTTLGPFDYALLFMLVFLAVTMGTYLQRFEFRAMTVLVPAILVMCVGFVVVWTLSSPAAMSDPELQTPLLVFAGVVLFGSITVSHLSYSVLASD